MANNKLQPHRSINYRCSQFPKIFRLQLHCVFELVFILKLDWTVKYNFQTQKDHLSNKYFLAISSTASIRVLEASEQNEM